MSGRNDIWELAQRFYAEPGVSQACLALQDKAGADVCLMLHLAMAGRIVPADEMAELDAAARPWRESVVIPLRSVRRALRQPPAGYPEADALRTSLAALEIEAERMQLAFLEASELPHRVQRSGLSGTARANLLAYCDLLKQPPGTMAHLLALLEDYLPRSGRS